VGCTVSDIYEAADGTLWLGTLKGLYTYHPATNTLRSFFARPGDPRSLSDNGRGDRTGRPGGQPVDWYAGGRPQPVRPADRHVYALPAPARQPVFAQQRPGHGAALGRGRRPVGGHGQRAQLPAPGSGGFTRYPDPENRISEVYGILEDGHGNLWINYREGIAKFEPRTRAWHYYQVSDGLQYEYNVGDNLRNADGEMFFSGVNGLTVFHPDSIRPNPFVPPVVITQFSVFNKPVTPDGTLLTKSISETPEISLSYRQAIFSFEFAALNFINPEENQYAYKLEGFEEDWNYAGTRRFASYSNVPGGKTYTFRVKASNDDGVWNQQGAAVRIYIAPAVLGNGVVQTAGRRHAGGAGVHLYKFRVRQYKRHRRQLEQEVRERTPRFRGKKTSWNGNPSKLPASTNCWCATTRSWKRT
jgi:hypothetical protein